VEREESIGPSTPVVSYWVKLIESCLLFEDVLGLRFSAADVGRMAALHDLLVLRRRKSRSVWSTLVGTERTLVYIDSLVAFLTSWSLNVAQSPLTS
jgi:hypothetical protein